jgi:hypothetical protein
MDPYKTGLDCEPAAIHDPQFSIVNVSRSWGNMPMSHRPTAVRLLLEVGQ